MKEGTADSIRASENWVSPVFRSKPSLHIGVPAPVRRLMWEVFFASRGRGVSLSTHFPWIDSASEVWSLSLCYPTGAKNHVQGDVAASLALKLVSNGNAPTYALVGLVCVAEDARKLGMCGRLMGAAIDFARLRCWDALVLWSQQPAIYTRHGFVIDGEELFGLVESAPSLSSSSFHIDSWPARSKKESQRGLPAFAISAQCISSADSRAVVLATAGGHAVAEWSGDDELVAALLHSALPHRWSLNANEGDGLIVELGRRGFKINLQRTRARLVLPLSSKCPKIPPIRVLDRI